MGWVGEAFFAYAVVGGLTVLEAFASGYVRECEEEVVDVVVTRVVGGAGFANEIREFDEERGAELRVFGSVGYYVDVVLGSDFGGEGELVEVFAGDDGGVFELFDGGGSVVSEAALGMLWIVSVGWGECGADAPALGNFDGGLDGDFFDWRVGGIEKEFFPFEDCELLADARGDDAVEVGVEGGDAGGDGYVELVEVFVVTAPGKDFAIGGEDDAGDLVDGAGGAMVAGDPLGSGEGDGAGSDRDLDLGVINLSGGIGEVRGDLDGGFLGFEEAGGAEDE
jgi:hypothetical protein